MIYRDDSSSGHERWSCSGDGHAVVRQPYMNHAQWMEAKEAFILEHWDHERIGEKAK